MANSKNIVAFAGCEGFDIIIYLSRILNKIGRKVLIADHSDTIAIASATPEITGLNITEDIVTYRDLDFTAKNLDEEMILPYDDILINCGMNRPRIIEFIVNKVVFITDMYQFNIKRIAQLDYYDGLFAENTLIIKDVVNTRLTTQSILSLLNKNITQDKVNIIYWDEGDYSNSLLINHGQTIGFKGISKSLRGLLLKEVQAMKPDITDKKLKMAFKLARKGE